MTDKSNIHDLLQDLHEEGGYVPERASIHYEWIEKHYGLLYELIEKQKYPLKKITAKLSSEVKISPQTLRKHYQAVKKLKFAEARQAKKQEQEGKKAGTSTVQRRHVDPSTVKPPPPLIQAEVIDE